ncbi:MAG: tRNA 5-methoxyuridine(34)/uridine 5-oxyacetic acid(34) synthase CmoB [Gammaproteobacteria bacterium]|nr:tRNA 5-methoxyuridine(34)/uridine 5-oxyacetic acid(34) synthase CmoB [Gammaproteobacteria bacterium]
MNSISVPPDGNRQIFPARLARCYDNVSHGDFPGWIDAVNGLPEISPLAVNLDADTISIGAASDCSPSQRETMRRQLQRLLPWRKGPFNLFGVEIDAEWRSDMKWRRLQDRIAPMSGRTVLDIGCGNGYYGWRMLGAGAHRVVGTDPTLRYVMQQRAVAKYLPEAPFDILPFTLETLVADTTDSSAAEVGSKLAASLLPADGFDTVFSMGVIYHRRDPVGHIRDLLRFLRQGGELVLESLIIDDKHGNVLHPRGRYARMRNIWAIPSIATLKNWLSDAGLTSIKVVDVSVTTPAEQRVTEWTFEQSLSDFLDPENSYLTIEGYPAPKRAILICSRK